jgi:large subunit ribosomal protein L2
MGKNLISQARGKGGPRYRSPSFRFVGAVKHRKYDEAEKSEVVVGKVLDLINCPGHSSPLARVQFSDGESTLILAAGGLRVKQEIQSGNGSSISIGNTLPLKKIPIGSSVFNIEKNAVDGGNFMRSAGCSAKIFSKGEGKVTIIFPSKKKLILDDNCRAVIGVVSGSGRKEKPIVKAGKRHHMMKARNKLYPQTSGVAMNSVDHPFGSGRGRHIGKHKIAPRYAPPGRKVGLVRAKRTGKRK